MARAGRTLGPFGRRLLLDTADDLPLPVVVLVAWLGAQQARRRRAAAA